jgi:hypothetical protein
MFFGYFGISLYQSGGLQTNVSAIAVQFNATRQQSDVFFIQASSLTFFTGQSAFD